MNKLLGYGLICLAITLALLLWVNTRDAINNDDSMTVSSLLSGQYDNGFSKAIEPRPFLFPDDHGPHPAFNTEWWYITGNLWDQDQTRYGYQLTFFRRGLLPQLKNNTGWQDKNIYMAHFAISNHQTGEFIANEKFGRNGAGIAGAQATPFRVWLDDWQIYSVNKESFFPLKLKAKNTVLAIELTLNTDKAMVLQGERGLSQKSAEQGNASYYYSFTRLNTTGTLINFPKESKPQETPSKGNKPTVSNLRGASWLDREWSTSALSKEQQGWDWFALQLKSGEELMFYRIRNKDGSVNSFSSGVLIDTEGHSTPLDTQSVTLTALKYWQKDNHQYPVQWRMQMTINNISKDWIISAPLEHQLLEVSVHYWEGAIDVMDNESKENIGVGFLEMTGY